MKYNPGILTAAQLLIARSPNIALNAIIWASGALPVKYGRVYTDKDGAPTWEPDTSVTPGGVDLVALVTKSGADLVDLDDCTLAFDCNGTTVVVTADFAAPANNEQRNAGAQRLTVNRAEDMNDVGSTAITAIDGINAGGTQNLPGNCEIEVWSLPNAAQYFAITCQKGLEFQPPGPAPIPIPCGRNPQEYVVPGRPDIKEVTFRENDFDYGRGLSALNGGAAVVRVDNEKNAAVITARYVFLDFYPQGGPSYPQEGNEEVFQESTGSFSRMFAFMSH